MRPSLLLTATFTAAAFALVFTFSLFHFGAPFTQNVCLAHSRTRPRNSQFFSGWYGQYFFTFGQLSDALQPVVAFIKPPCQAAFHLFSALAQTTSPKPPSTSQFCHTNDAINTVPHEFLGKCLFNQGHPNLDQ